jgi:hypothetical protein
MPISSKLGNAQLGTAWLGSWYSLEGTLVYALATAAIGTAPTVTFRRGWVAGVSPCAGIGVVPNGKIYPTHPTQRYNSGGVQGTGTPLVAGGSFSSAYTFANSGVLGYPRSVSAGVTSGSGSAPAVQVGIGATVLVAPATGTGAAPAVGIIAGQFVSEGGPAFATGAVPPVMFHLGDSVPAGALIGVGNVPGPALSYGWVFSVGPVGAAADAPAVQVHTGCTVFAGPVSATSTVPAVSFTYGYVLFARPTASPGVLPPEVIGTGWTVPVSVASASGTAPGVQVLVVVDAGPLSCTGAIPSPLLITRGTVCTLNLTANAAPAGQGLLDLYTLITRARWKVLVTGSVWINAGALAAQGTTPAASIRVWLPAGVLASQGTLPGVTIYV